MGTQDSLTYLPGQALQYAATEAELQALMYMSNNPIIMMRLAHVLLIYAEALTCTTSEAYTVNDVRQWGRLGAGFAAAAINGRDGGADAPAIPDL